MRTIRTIIAFCFIGCLSAFAQRFPMAVETINPGLLGLNPNTINTNAWVLGLNSVTDGQGGWFTWWKNDTTATDTFNVFQPTWAGAPSGRWKRTPFYGSFSGSILTGPLILSDGYGAISSNAALANVTITSNGLYLLTISSTNLTTLSGMLTNLYAGRSESQAYTITASNNLYSTIISSTNLTTLSGMMTNLYSGRSESQSYTLASTNLLATYAGWLLPAASPALTNALIAWTQGASYQFTNVLFSNVGIATQATGVWPDGSAMTFNVTSNDPVYLSIDAYVMTYTNGSSGQKVVQNPVTRGPLGGVTIKPALLVQ